jgi:hypothetical protein
LHRLTVQDLIEDDGEYISEGDISPEKVGAILEQN